MVGVRRFTVAEVLARFKRWDEALCLGALQELIAARLVVYDPKARLVFAAMTFDHSPLIGKGPKTIKGACGKLGEFPDSPALVPALKHVLDALEDAMGTAAEASKAELGRWLTSLQIRLEQIQSANPEAPLMGYPGEETQAGQLGKPGSPMQGVSMPHARGIDGVSGAGAISGGQGGTHTTPSNRSSPEGVSKGYRRGIEGASGFDRDALTDTETDTETDFKTKTPPNPPKGQGARQETGRGKERGKYAGLDQRGR